MFKYSAHTECLSLFIPHTIIWIFQLNYRNQHFLFSILSATVNLKTPLRHCITIISVNLIVSLFSRANYVTASFSAGTNNSKMLNEAIWVEQFLYTLNYRYRYKLPKSSEMPGIYCGRWLVIVEGMLKFVIKAKKIRHSPRGSESLLSCWSIEGIEDHWANKLFILRMSRPQ